MTLPEDTILLNRYRIDGLLAHGGMGAVYRAFDTNLNTPVAIKENFFQTPQQIAQFKQEALILARLRHPALPRVSQHFSFEGQQYLVMDFVEGENLWEIIRQRGQPLTEPEALDYLIQVCQAVSYLHQQRPPIIHRDIKPQNIKITPEGKAVLVDFGIAKQVEAEAQRTEAGARGVTPGFSPPEQHNGAGTTPASDVYALGATLYAMLTGKKPPSSVSLLAGAIKFEAPNLTNPAISQQTAQAISHAMQLQPQLRPPTVADWQKRLEAIARVLPPPGQAEAQPAVKNDEAAAAPSAATTAAFWLVDQRGIGHPVGPQPVSLGRQPEADVVIEDLNVSRRHAQVMVKHERCFVLDENSANGTFLNNQRLGADWYPFDPGDVLIIGPARFYLTTTRPVKVAPPKPAPPPPAADVTAVNVTVTGTSPISLPAETPPPARPKSGRWSGLGLMLLAALVIIGAVGAGIAWFRPGSAALVAVVSPTRITALPTLTRTPTATALPTVQPLAQFVTTTAKADVLEVASPTATASPAPEVITATATLTATVNITPTVVRVVTPRPTVAAGPTASPLKSNVSVPELGHHEVIDVDINPKNPAEVYALVKRDGIYKSVTGGGGPWARVDLDGSGLTALTIDPTTPTRLYAPTWNGVLKTTDGGNTWEAKTNGLVSNQVVDVVTVNPANPNLLFAGIGETLVASTDQGETWSSQGYGIGVGASRLYQIVIDPFDPNTVYVAGLGAAIYKSQDGGRNFIPLPFNMGNGVFGIAAHPGRKSVYLAGINSFSAGIIKTENGFDFHPASVGLIYGGADSAYSAITYAPGNPNIVYAGSGFESEPNSKGIFKSSDGGETWQRINNGLAINPDTGFPHYVKSIAVHPTNPDIVFAATGSGLYQSSDGGATWQLK